MELARADSYAVTAPFDMWRMLERRGAQLVPKPSETPVSVRERLTDYLLGGGNARILCEPRYVRDAWAEACQFATGGLAIAKPYPLLRCHDGILVSSRFPEVWVNDELVRVRVAFDFDLADGKANEPFPDPNELFARVCTFLQDNTTEGLEGTYDYGTEAASLFLGSNDKKNRTAHLYFHDLCFAPDISNKLKKGDPLCAAFTDAIGFGLEADLGIQGIKWLFMDKHDGAAGWRGAVLPVTKHFNSPPVEFWTDLADCCSPHALPGDAAWQRNVTWQPMAHKRVRLDAAPPQQQQITTVVDLQVERLRAFIGVNAHDLPVQRQGALLVPQTRYCPLKGGEHKGPNKFYAVVHADGSMELKCQNSKCKALTLPPEDPNAALMQRVDKVFARVGTKALLLASLQPPYSDLMLLSRTAGNDHVAAIEFNREGPLSIGKKEVTVFNYWFERTQRHYADTCFAPPPHPAPPGFFNTFLGFNPDVVRIADTMTEFTVEQLAAEFPYLWAHLRSNICDHDEPAVRQVMGFFGDLVQNPGRKPKWALFLHGHQGCGKGLLVQFMAKIVGPRLFNHADVKSIAEDFNGGLMEKLLIYSDEGIDTSKGDAYLKKLLTEETQVMREKYLVNRQVATFFRMVAASNDEPTCVKVGDRRWLTLYCDVRTELDGVPHLFVREILAETESLRGPAAFFEFARRGYFAEHFNPMEAISTADKIGLQELTLTPFDSFWRLRLESDAPDESGNKMSKSDFYSSYLATVPERKKHEESAVKFWRRCLQLLPEPRWGFSKSNGARYFVMPARADLRAAYCRLNKFPPSIFEEN